MSEGTTTTLREKVARELRDLNYAAEMADDWREHLGDADRILRLVFDHLDGRLHELMQTLLDATCPEALPEESELFRDACLHGVETVLEAACKEVLGDG